jgi:predicted ribosome quality control (RQC) complex YloA/Tae2 family protein
MSINRSYFENFVNKNKNELINQRINRIVQITKCDFYLLLIPSKKYLHISLNANNPFISLENELIYTKLETSQSLNQLKKQIDDARILNIQTINEDKIIEIDIKKTYDNYEVLNGKVIIEFMTNHPNLIILNEQSNIIFAMHYTTIESSRLLGLNLPYELPIKGNKSTLEHEDGQDIKLISTYNENLISEVKKEQYGKMIKKVTQSIKQLTKRILTLTEILGDSSRFETFKAAGDYVYSNLNEDFKSFEINGTTFNLNPQLSKIENANAFYKKYKKLKEGNKFNQDFLKKAQDDLEYFNNLKFQIDNASLDDMEEIQQELEDNKILSPSIKTKKKIKSIMPYYVNFNNTLIYFGKNNIQNDTLTFALAKSNYYYFHVKDYHGSHVIIFSPNPSKECIQKACEIALFLSHLTTGDVLLADVKDVKKASHPGLVNILKYQTIHISSFINEEIKSLIEQAER